MKFRRMTAFLLVLCMVLSLSISAFAADKETSGYLSWELRDDGTLTISGNGRIAAFTSAEDQPWHEMRESITSVKFDPGAHMIVSDVAYWFSGCVNLKSCVLLSFANLGADTFKDCEKLTRLQLYYNDTNFYISDSAFSSVDMTALEIVTCDEITMGILDAKGIAFVAAYPVATASSGPCGVSGCNCTSCSFTYDYEEKDESKHYAWECCTNCSANEYAYRHTESHSFNSRGICSKCGYEEDAADCHTRSLWCSFRPAEQDSGSSGSRGRHNRTGSGIAGIAWAAEKPSSGILRQASGNAGTQPRHTAGAAEEGADVLPSPRYRRNCAHGSWDQHGSSIGGAEARCGKDGQEAVCSADRQNPGIHSVTSRSA